MNPYENLEGRAFWSTAVAKRNMFDIAELWVPKFALRQDMKFVTFGSCFAQHIGKALAANGYNWVDFEPAPSGLSEDNARLFNYGIFSARTGNIYTASLLGQWLDWSAGKKEIPPEIWESDGRFYDPFRPNIEPNGFASRKELELSREAAVRAFARCLKNADVFVFTLGLTESWFNTAEAYEYPMCPGTLAGTFDATLHNFVNQDYRLINRRLREVIIAVKRLNPSIHFLLTVSPVPLTATMSGNHVLVATIESKSILRAVAGNIARSFDFVDYFPSYEIINGTPFRGSFFEANQRSVNPAGVQHVMKQFLTA